ncbi:hypothetical protein MRX96_003571 [Rhipicephalus microplus]
MEDHEMALLYDPHGDGPKLLEDLKVKYLSTEKGQYPVPERRRGGANAYRPGHIWFYLSVLNSLDFMITGTKSHKNRNRQVTIFHLAGNIIFELDSFFNEKRMSENRKRWSKHYAPPLQRLGGSASRGGARHALQRALQRVSQRSELGWGARFVEMTTIDSDSSDQLNCMNADDFALMVNVGHGDSTPGPSGVAEASNNTYLWSSVPHTSWFREIDAHQKKVVAEEVSAVQSATFH